MLGGCWDGGEAQGGQRTLAMRLVDMMVLMEE